MRFLFLTPGTGHFYCGSCLRDHALATALRRAGHEVTVAPLYLPLMLEEPSEAEQQAPVHMGGINMYLQQKAKLAGKLPGFVKRLLDRPGLLRFASKRGNMTDTSALGAMTLSMLQGEHGRQNQEVEDLVAWAQGEPEPDVVVISNLLLTGIVRRLKQALGKPIVATMQGEAPFLDSLPQPWRDRAWAELTERVEEIDALIPVSESYGDVIREKLALDRPITAIHNGLDLDGFRDAPPRLAERGPVIGYLARMCEDKGLHTLVDAFVILKTRGTVPDARLKICGVMLAEDRAFVAERTTRLDQHVDAVSFHPNLERRDKLEHLRSFSVFSVPATYGESFGLYVLEALASGVPVVEPRHGAFPELLEATQGGILCEPDDPVALADALERLLTDQDEAQRLADQGRQAVLDHFHADRMAAEFAAVCKGL